MAAATRQGLASSAARPAIPIERLRRMLCAVEASTGLAAEERPLVPLGIPVIDNVLGGGLGCGALHEIAAAREAELAAATGFALALSGRRDGGAPRSPFPVRRPMARGARAPAFSSPTARSVIWIADDLSLAESGVPYGPGLDETGIAPEQLIRVATARGRDVLWAMEEALRCRAVGVVIGEMRASGIDQVATRRLSLAAAAGDRLGLILRSAPDVEPSAAATRWIVGAALPSSPMPFSARSDRRRGVGPPRLAARLVRNRRGHLGAWIVEWNSVEQRFELATRTELVAGAVIDRPARAAVA